LIIFPIIGFACTCFSISKKDARKISRKADYVVLGYATENIHPNDTIKGDWDRMQKGYEVKFKVEKVYKGKIDSEFIYINQFETGNCVESFEFGKKYIIVGTRIKEFENVRPLNARLEFKEDDIFETFPPPPPPPLGGLSINKMKCYYEEKSVVEYWNEIAKREIVVYTNQCSSFYPNSTYGRYFVR
jgi:hypothetical protein